MRQLHNVIASLNRSQRIGVFVAIAMTLLFAFLHNPLDGYCGEHICDISSPRAMLDALWEGEAQSVNPIFFWFGPVSHLISAVVAIWVLCLAWLYLFRGE